MTQTLALIHTGPLVIPPLKALTAEHLPGVRVVNLLDDRIVADIEAAGGEVPPSVTERLYLLARAAVWAGADAILLTCSSISPLAHQVGAVVGVPVLRIDEAMADAAVAAGRRIAVVATLPTTLEPTCGLIRERAARAGVEVSIARALCREGFELASAGDGDGHDRVVRAAVERLAGEADVVVLAQASMARAVTGLSVGVRVLSSPELGVLRTRDALAELADGADG